MTEKPRRVVLDTNVLVSRLISPKSVPARVTLYVLTSCDLLLSAAIVEELEDVFRRPKFDRYHDLDIRLAFLLQLVLTAKPVRVVDKVMDCRDPRDNMFLELALSGRADVIVTGDDDLLCLHPWRGIAILSPADYLAQVR